MLRNVLKSEIRRATVTDGVVDRREGLELPSDLVDAAGLCDGERVLVVSETTGRRLETFVQAGDPRTGVYEKAAGLHRRLWKS